VSGSGRGRETKPSGKQESCHSKRSVRCSQLQDCLTLCLQTLDKGLPGSSHPTSSISEAAPRGLKSPPVVPQLLHASQRWAPHNRIWGVVRPCESLRRCEKLKITTRRRLQGVNAEQGSTSAARNFDCRCRSVLTTSGRKHPGPALKIRRRRTWKSVLSRYLEPFDTGRTTCVCSVLLERRVGTREGSSEKLG